MHLLSPRAPRRHVFTRSLPRPTEVGAEAMPRVERQGRRRWCQLRANAPARSARFALKQTQTLGVSGLLLALDTAALTGAAWGFSCLSKPCFPRIPWSAPVIQGPIKHREVRKEAYRWPPSLRSLNTAFEGDDCCRLRGTFESGPFGRTNETGRPCPGAPGGHGVRGLKNRRLSKRIVQAHSAGQ